MGAGHSHAPRSLTRRQRSSRRRAVWAMLCILVPLGLAAVLGMILLWPSGSQAGGGASGDAAFGGSDFLRGQVVAADLSDCQPQDPMPADGCARVEVQVGERTGSLYLPPEAVAAGVEAGDAVRVIDLSEDPDLFADDPQLAAEDPGAFGVATDFVFVDYDRTVPLGLLAALYALVVVAVAGWRGLRALIGLGLAFGIMLGFMLPALVAGHPPLLVALIASTVIMYLVLYLAHGLTARTSTALLGTIAGIVITTLLGAWMTDWSNLAGVYSEDAYVLDSLASIDPRGLIMCGMVIAGLGVLNDVTITQASAVWELRESSPALGPRGVFARAMRIGRDHIASTVYTIAFAYAGAALATLLLITVLDRSLIDALTMGDIAVEVARTLVGSIGLVLAIPMTTAIAVLISFATQAPEEAPGEAPAEATA